MKKTYFFFTIMVFACCNVFAQSIFDNPITGTNPNTSNPYTTGQTVNTNITASGIGRGTGVSGSNANNRYNANGWNSASLDATDFFEFTLTPNTGIGINFISFVYTGQVNNATIANFVFRSSLDGYTANIGTPTATGATIDLSAPVYQNITAPITFRLYAWGADQNSRTFSVNDFTFNGLTTVLPITIEYFNGVKQSNSNVLNWKVNCTSSPKAILDVERSADADNFKSISNIVADAVRCQQPFDYTDNNPLPGYNYYRLKMTDENNKVTYSPKVVLLNKETGFDITALQPSVVNNTAVLNITTAQKMQLTIIVTDLTGRQVQKNVYSLVAGNNRIPMNFTKLLAGAYQIAGYSVEEKTRTIRFIKQ